MPGPIKIGSVTIDAIGQLKVGSSNVQAAYVGANQIFPAPTTTTTTSTTTSTTTEAPTTTTTTSTTSTTTTEAPTTTTTTTSTTSTTSTTTTTTTSGFQLVSLGYDLTDGYNACTQYTLDAGTYYIAIADTLTNGTVIYSDEGITPAINGYYSDGTNYWLVSSGGVLSGQTSCTQTTTTTTTTTTSTTTSTTTEAPTTTTTTTSTTTSTTTVAPTTTTTTSTTTSTTTLGYVAFDLAYSTVDGQTACDDYPTVNTSTYYAAPGSILQTGTIIYTDTALTTPAVDGFYSNGVNYWNTGANSGNLQNQTSCGSTTTTTTTTTSTTTTTTTSAPTTTSTTTTTTTTAASASLFVNNANSLDIPITDITVNGVSVTFVSGTDFTINAGNNGNFETDEIGTFDILVYYGSHTAGQNITITDSANNVFCCDLNGSAGSCNFIGAVINTSQTIQVVASDGACV